MSTTNNEHNNNSGIGDAKSPQYFSFLADSGYFPSILYIEDSYSHVLLVKRVLEIIPSVQFKFATSAEDGLRLAITETPDLILLDMRLPIIDGYEILESLKLHPLTRHTPVIALSGASTPREIEKGLDLGLQRYLTKPINIREFLVAIKEELDEVYLHRQSR